MVPALLALLVLAGVILLILSFLRLVTEPRPSEPDAYGDAATPYVEALDVAFRIQQAAWEAEKQIYAAAVRHAEDDPEGGAP
jgi:hypothetical protein